MNLEYRIVNEGKLLSVPEATAMLNSMAAEGWELVLYSDWLQWWIFKKEK